MRAGDLDQRIHVLQRAVTRDEYGGEKEAWEPALTLWAKREDVGGMESVRAGQTASTVEARFTIRDPVTPIDATMRVRHGSEDFEIMKIARLPGRRVGFEILAQSRDRAGTQDLP